jgi:hypothetical protein
LTRQTDRDVDVGATHAHRKKLVSPRKPRLDKRPEVIGRDLEPRALVLGMTLAFTGPGKPRSKVFIESLNRNLGRSN